MISVFGSFVDNEEIRNVSDCMKSQWMGFGNQVKEFEKKYKDYFMNNYRKQFVENQLPTNPEDAAIFDIQEAKMAKAQAFIEANNL